MQLTESQLDRACGALLGMAAGDALGAPYEFQPPRGPGLEVDMVGGGGFGWEPGEWTDDTSMAVAIAEVAAAGLDLRTEAAQDAVVARWYEWAQTASDVGIQTRAVLGAAHERYQRRNHGRINAADSRWAAERHHRLSGKSGGNGSLMRTAPVALAHLGDEDAIVEAAAALSALTHLDPEAGEACALWCLAINRAVLTGILDLRQGLARLPVRRRENWSTRISQAENSRPADFAHNGWVVEALQGAWSAITTAGAELDDATADTRAADHLPRGLDAAVRGGRDTDTVAAIAGALLGAAHGASAVPDRWRALLHGWPGLIADDLVVLATSVAT